MDTQIVTEKTILKCLKEAAKRNDTFIDFNKLSVDSSNNPIVWLVDSPTNENYISVFFGYDSCKELSNRYYPNFKEDYEENPFFCKEKLETQRIKDCLYIKAKRLFEFFEEIKEMSKHVSHYRKAGYDNLGISEITLHLPFKKFDCVYTTTIKLEDVEKNQSFLTGLSPRRDSNSYYKELDKLILLEENIYNPKG